MRTVTVAFALACGLGAAASAQEIGARPLDAGDRVTIVGEISSQPRDFGFVNESKMQVAVGPEKTDHTLHLRDAEIVNERGEKLAKSDLLDKWWVRADGALMKDRRRIKVSRLVVLSKDYEGYQRSAQFRAESPRGYVVAENVAGARQVLPSTRVFAPGTRVVVVAPITSQPREAGVAVEDKFQVGIGAEPTDYTLHVSKAHMVGLNGDRVYSSGLRDKMWVRAEGRVMDDSRRIEVERMTVIASDHEAYRRTPDFREDEKGGYIRALDPVK